MHAWAATAIALLGVGLGVLGARKLGTARDADKAAISWRTSWQGKVKEIFPAATTPPPTVTPLMMIEDEIKRREETNTRPAGIEPAKPVMRELELMSLVLASPTVEVLAISLDSGAVPSIEVLVPTTSEAEAVLEGLRRVGGSRVTNWAMEILPSGDKRRARYSGRWQEGNAPRSGT
jgi:CBS domain-containing protein